MKNYGGKHRYESRTLILVSTNEFNTIIIKHALEKKILSST